MELAFHAPLPLGHKVEHGNVVITFAHAVGGLMAKDRALEGIAVASADKKRVKANARIEGERVTASSTEVKNPPFAMAGRVNPDCNPYNGAGFLHRRLAMKRYAAISHIFIHNCYTLHI